MLIYLNTIMKIILKEPESGTVLELLADKVDIAAVNAWSILFPTGKKTLIRCCNGVWKTENYSNISPQFWQIVGNEITRLVDADEFHKNKNANFSAADARLKRRRTMKYQLN